MNQKTICCICLLGLLLIFSCTDSGTQKRKMNAVSIKDTVINNTSASLQSEITCPNCGNKKMEALPTDVCLIKYKCANCDTVLFPKEGDCCVFCTYGTHKCPSKQGN